MNPEVQDRSGKHGVSHHKNKTIVTNWRCTVTVSPHTEPSSLQLKELGRAHRRGEKATDVLQEKHTLQGAAGQMRRLRGSEWLGGPPAFSVRPVSHAGRVCAPHWAGASGDHWGVGAARRRYRSGATLGDPKRPARSPAGCAGGQGGRPGQALASLRAPARTLRQASPPCCAPEAGMVHTLSPPTSSPLCRNLILDLRRWK